MNRAFIPWDSSNVPFMGRRFVAWGLQPRVLVADHENYYHLFIFLNSIMSRYS